jgi:hypothetical protein
MTTRLTWILSAPANSRAYRADFTSRDLRAKAAYLLDTVM